MRLGIGRPVSPQPVTGQQVRRRPTSTRPRPIRGQLGPGKGLGRAREIDRLLFETCRWRDVEVTRLMKPGVVVFWGGPTGTRNNNRVPLRL